MDPLTPDEDQDVRARRAGWQGTMERMDRDDWADAQTPFGRAVRGNINSLHRQQMVIAAWAYDGHKALEREADLRGLLIGADSDRERAVDEGGAIGRIERKIDRLILFVRWFIGVAVGAAGVYATWRTMHP